MEKKMEKKMKHKKWMIMILTLLCAVLLSGMGVSAAGKKTVATIGKKKYTSLEKALAKVKNGQTIKLKANITANKTIEVKRNVRFTLDFNGKTIKSSRGRIADGLGNTKGILRISKGNVVIKKGKMTGNASIKIEKGAAVKIMNGSYCQLVNKGSVTVVNGSFRTKDTATSAVANYGKGKMVIKNATVQAQIGGALYVEGGTVAINNGTFNQSKSKGDISYAGIIIKKAGKLTIRKGKFTVKDRNSLIETYGKLTIENGVFQHLSENGVSAIAMFEGSETIINGGTFTSNIRGNSTILLHSMAGSKISVNGGTFTAQQGVVWENYGSAVLTGGTLISLKNPGEAVYNSGTFTMSGGAIRQESSNSYGSALRVTKETTTSISGGSIYSKQGEAISIINSVRGVKKFALTGGTVQAGSGARYAIYVSKKENAVSINKNCIKTAGGTAKVFYQDIMSYEY